MRPLCFALIFLVGCSGSINTSDAGVEPDEDAGAFDSGTSISDAGTADSGQPDAGAADSGTADAGPTDSGTPDAGPVDAGPTDAGKLDAGSCNSPFCDGFETYDAGAGPKGPWSTSVAGGSVTIDTAKSHSGARSVKVTTDGTQAYRRAYFGMTGPFFPVTGNAFYGRMWVYLTAAPAMTTHWTNISGEGMATHNGTSFQAYVRYGGQVAKHLMANYDSATFSSDCWQHSTVAFPEGKWACMEWHFDGPNSKMEFWLDSTQIPALTVNQMGQGCIANGLNGQWVMPNFTNLRLGWEHYQTSIPIEMWVDDVALDTKRIGCQ